MIIGTRTKEAKVGVEDGEGTWQWWKDIDTLIKGEIKPGF